MPNFKFVSSGAKERCLIVFAIGLTFARPGPSAEKRVILPANAAPTSAYVSPAIQSGEFTYVSGMVGRGPKGAIAGDAAAQMRQALENMRSTLKTAGLGLKDVVSTNVYIADIRNLGAVDRVYREYFRPPFPARTTLEALLTGPDEMVEISAITASTTLPRQAINPTGWPAPATPLSYAVRAGDTLFLSSLKPVNPETGALAGLAITAQTQQVMSNQEEILKTAGMSFADLTVSRIYLADPADYQGLNEVYRMFVKAVPPARATINPRLSDASYLIEMQSVAVHGSGEGRPSGAGHTSPIHSFSVMAGDRLYITGMTGRAADGSVARGDIRAQTKQSLQTIEEQLRKHGMTFANVVDATVWMRDARQFAEMNEVYGEIAGPHPPARTTVRIPPNSGESLIEIMMLAVK
jgi:enamine deaminase RidA (YjgF/YER057c/UK114 family)